MARNQQHPNSKAAWLRGSFIGSIRRMRITSIDIQRNARDGKEAGLARDVGDLLDLLDQELRMKK